MRATVYTVPNCADCAAVKRLLEAHNVPYTEKNVRGDPGTLEEMMRAANVRIAPVTVIEGQAFYGPFDEQRARLEAVLHGGEGAAGHT